HLYIFFFSNHPPHTGIYTLSLHDALPIWESVALLGPNGSGKSTVVNTISGLLAAKAGEIRFDGASLKARPTHVRASLGIAHVLEDRKSTRLNSSHVAISYAVFCLKKKKNI